MSIDAIKNNLKIVSRPYSYLSRCLGYSRTVQSVKKSFQKRMGYPLDIDNPQTFSEKLQWLKLNYSDECLVAYSDKLAFKDHITEMGLDHYKIKTFDSASSFNGINWETLPKSFVLKTNHDSGSVWLVHDKNAANTELLEKKVDTSLKSTFGLKTFEYNYQKIYPRVFAEEMLYDCDLKDFKFFCFNGKPHYIQVDFDRATNHTRNFYNTRWERLNFSTSGYKISDRVIERPDHLDEMLEVSEIIASTLPFLRVDLYYVNKKIYIGEATFFPSAGWGKFSESSWDLKLGNLLKLPENLKNYEPGKRVYE
ncbi:hypothetical protein PsW64_00945 [Pseudovibrio sp. W64]|uniref:ATP-grasp fold amidoligase family protein n=1 Tax=Pseudovibrio sp. W64 TaxID=1735583 RepID=UPI0007B2578A|nr:ATP-grasp fold amidoligase family protein [Pseudovibrio sp. W64]KZK87648.1 hypothetical protein PsW64_00945 [Pseudovibrio sp. W64]